MVRLASKPNYSDGEHLQRSKARSPRHCRLHVERSGTGRRQWRRRRFLGGRTTIGTGAIPPFVGLWSADRDFPMFSHREMAPEALQGTENSQGDPWAGGPPPVGKIRIWQIVGRW